MTRPEEKVEITLRPHNMSDAPLVRLRNGRLVELVAVSYQGRHPVFELWTPEYQGIRFSR